MSEPIFYTIKDLLNYPYFEPDNSGTYYYDAIMVFPTGEIREDEKGYPEFAIVGCKPGLVPKEIITMCHAMQIDFLLDPVKGRFKFDMVGPNIMRIWSPEHELAFHLTSSEAMDFHLVKRD